MSSAARSCDPGAVVPEFRWIPQPFPAYLGDWIFEADTEHRLGLVRDYLFDAFVELTPVWLFAPTDSRERVSTLRRAFPHAFIRTASIGENCDEVLSRIGDPPMVERMVIPSWPDDARANFTTALLEVAEKNLVEGSILRSDGRAQFVGRRFREQRLYVDWDLDPDRTMAATRPGGELYTAIAFP
jgi:hypothetical protein